MRDERPASVSWFKEHRKQLIAIGISATAIASIIATAYINRDALAELWQTLKAMLEQTNSSHAITSDDVTGQGTTVITELSAEIISTTERTIITKKRSYSACTVREHLRKIAPKRPSPNKYPALKSYGLTPDDGYTVIIEHKKGTAIAA